MFSFARHHGGELSRLILAAFYGNDEFATMCLEMMILCALKVISKIMATLLLNHKTQMCVWSTNANERKNKTVLTEKIQFERFVLPRCVCHLSKISMYIDEECMISTTSAGHLASAGRM